MAKKTNPNQVMQRFIKGTGDNPIGTTLVYLRSNESVVLEFDSDMMPLYVDEYGKAELEAFVKHKLDLFSSEKKIKDYRKPVVASDIATFLKEKNLT